MISAPFHFTYGINNELCFCRIKLFRDHGAERKTSNDLAHVKKTIDKLKQQIAQLDDGTSDLGWPFAKLPHKELAKRPAEEVHLRQKLAVMQGMLSSVRPNSVLDLKGEGRDDPDTFPVPPPWHLTAKPEVPCQPACLKSAMLDHQSIDCPSIENGVRNWRGCTDFWSYRPSRSRAASVHSQSSERNSSLHGSGRIDPEDQDLSFPDHQSRRSSASFSDTAASFPQPPVHIAREKNTKVDAGEASESPAYKPLRFSCDICGQDIEVLRRRDWQWVIFRHVIT